MQRPALLLAAALASFLLFVVTGIPARIATDFLRGAGVEAGAASGTIWRGQVASLRVAGLSLGRTRWSLHPLSLLLGRVAADVEAELPGGFVRGRVEAGPGARLALLDTEAASPLDNLAPVLGLPVAGGEANASVQRVILEDRWLTAAVGEVRIGNLPLALPGMAPEPGAVGSFSATFDVPELTAGEPLVGTLRDLGGALEISGSISLSPPNNYAVAGRLRPRDPAPPSLTEGLVLFGPADAEGRREFALSGSF